MNFLSMSIQYVFYVFKSLYKFYKSAKNYNLLIKYLHSYGNKLTGHSITYNYVIYVYLIIFLSWSSVIPVNDMAKNVHILSVLKKSTTEITILLLVCFSVSIWRWTSASDVVQLSAGPEDSNDALQQHLLNIHHISVPILYSFPSCNLSLGLFYSTSTGIPC